MGSAFIAAQSLVQMCMQGIQCSWHLHVDGFGFLWMLPGSHWKPPPCAAHALSLACWLGMLAWYQLGMLAWHAGLVPWC